MFYVHAASCGGYRHGVWTGPTRCPQPVVAAGLVVGRDPRRPAVWLAFTCAEHVGHLDVARPLPPPSSGGSAARPRPPG